MTLHLTLDTNTEFLRAIDLWQTPISALVPFWDGENVAFAEFCKTHKLYWRNVATIDEAKSQAAALIDQMAALFKREIGRFDFRLSTAFSARGLVAITDVEIAHLQLAFPDCSPEESKQLKEIVSELTTRSFLDFRSIHESSIDIYYSRRGYYEDDNKIGVYTAKQAYSLKDNFKNPKDNNFILSGICLELAHLLPNLRLCYTYTNGMGGKVDCEVSGAEILQALEQKSITQQAKDELQKEAQKTRVSLPPESIEERLKQPTTQIRFNPHEDLENFFERNFEHYQLKEAQKLNLKLQKAKEQALNAYAYLTTQIESGIAIKEAMDLVKQKYRDDDTLNLASLLLTKDLLELGNKDAQITQLKEEIAELETTLDEYRQTITKREETIGSLRATVSEKVNALNLYKEEAQKLLTSSLNELETQLQTEIDRLTQLLNQKQAESDEQSTLIDRLSIENGFLKERCNELKESNLKLEGRVEGLQQQIWEVLGTNKPKE